MSDTLYTINNIMEYILNLNYIYKLKVMYIYIFLMNFSFNENLKIPKDKLLTLLALWVENVQQIQE